MNGPDRTAPPPREPRPEGPGTAIWMAGLVAVMVILLLMFVVAL